jgi:uncharacterized protein YggE
MWMTPLGRFWTSTRSERTPPLASARGTLPDVKSPRYYGSTKRFAELSLTEKATLTATLLALVALAGVAYLVFNQPLVKREPVVAVVAASGANVGTNANVSTVSGSVAPDGVSVTGTGSVDVVPDQVQWTFTVTASAMQAHDALVEIAAKIDAVRAAVRHRHIPSKSVQTQVVALSPNYDSQGKRVTGYNASSSLTVVAGVVDSGALVDAVVKAGATQVDGPSLSNASTEALYKQALRLAFAEAKGRAQELAAAAGVTLGAPTAIDAVDGGSPPIVYGAAKAATATVGISPGTSQVTATVNVTFAIK